MPRKLREYLCEDCGKLTRRNRVSSEPWICVECGLMRQYYSTLPNHRPVSFVADSDGEVFST